MLLLEHSAILLTFIKLPFGNKFFILFFFWVAVLHRFYCTWSSFNWQIACNAIQYFRQSLSVLVCLCLSCLSISHSVSVCHCLSCFSISHPSLSLSSHLCLSLYLSLCLSLRESERLNFTSQVICRWQKTILACKGLIKVQKNILYFCNLEI